MEGRCFIDTNVLIYSVDKADPFKQQTALSLIAGHAKARTGVISTQVLQEFFSAATRKLGIDRCWSGNISAIFGCLISFR